MSRDGRSNFHVNHFSCEDLVHHPIDFQPFFFKWMLRVPGMDGLFSGNECNFAHSQEEHSEQGPFFLPWKLVDFVVFFVEM